MTEQPQDPKIVVDEDWKERVRAEREADREARKKGDSTDRGGPQSGAAPPDPFSMLVSSLAAEAMIALGQAPDPTQGHPIVRPEVARHSIDMLSMLEEKTKGNLSDEEAQMLDSLLHQLRMLYVQVYRQPAEAPASGEKEAAGGSRAPGADSDAKTGGEAPPAGESGSAADEGTEAPPAPESS